MQRQVQHKSLQKGGDIGGDSNFIKTTLQVLSNLITCYYVKNAINCFTSVALVLGDNCPEASSAFPFLHTICTMQGKRRRNALRTFT